MSTLKEEVLQMVASMEDESDLATVKAEIEFMRGSTDGDYILDILSPAQLDELTTILNEPFGHDTEPYEDFKKATERWRTK